MSTALFSCATLLTGVCALHLHNETSRAVIGARDALSALTGPGFVRASDDLEGTSTNTHTHNIQRQLLQLPISTFASRSLPALYRSPAPTAPMELASHRVTVFNNKVFDVKGPALCVDQSYCMSMVFKTILLHGGFASTLSSIFHHVLEGECAPGRTVIDVGANIGWFTLLAASHGCDVIAIEPQPVAAAIIQQALRANPSLAQRVIVLNNLVSRVVGEKFVVRFPRRKHWGWATFIRAPPDTSETVYTAASIDRVVQDLQISDVLLLKIDTEGMEREVMKSALGSLRKGLVHNILVEIKWQEPASPRMLGDLASLYRFVNISSYKENYHEDLAVKHKISLTPVACRKTRGPSTKRTESVHSKAQVMCFRNNVAHEDFWLQRKIAEVGDASTREQEAPDMGHW
mmetsp:Transcript_6462/g.18788  ORF Transcript_6462/g.18788 Transcript_6462/m.18788 type:complete len:403 (-) Transcript_6462:213-1421(-)